MHLDEHLCPLRVVIRVDVTARSCKAWRGFPGLGGHVACAVLASRCRDGEASETHLVSIGRQESCVRRPAAVRG